MIGYRARVLEHADYFVRGRALIFVARELSDGSLELEEIEKTPVPDHPDAVTFTVRTHRIDPAASIPPGVLHGLNVPSGALEAIRDARDEHLGRRRDDAVAFELRAALEHERTRYAELVERVVDRLPELGALLELGRGLE